MATYTITAPNGQSYTIDGPEGASNSDVQAEVLRQYPEAAGSTDGTIDPETGALNVDVVGGQAGDIAPDQRAMKTANPNYVDDLMGATVNTVAGIGQGLAAIPDAATKALGGIMGQGAEYVADKFANSADAMGATETGQAIHDFGQQLKSSWLNPITIGGLIEAGAPTPKDDAGWWARFLSQVAGGAVSVPGVTTLPASMAQGTPKAVANAAPTAVAKAAAMGIDLPMGAAGGRGSAIVDNTLSVMPGSATVMSDARQKLTGQVANAVDNVASIAGQASGNTGLGRAVTRGVESAMQRGRDKVSALYDKIGIAPSTPADLKATVPYLEEMASKFASNAKLAALKVSPKITAYRDALKDGLSFQDLKAFRSDIGDDIGEAIIGEGASRKELRGLYAALSSDMEATALAQGPKALAQFRQANASAQRNFDLQEKVFAPIIGKAADKSPEGISRAFMSMVRDGRASADIAHLARMRGSMTPEEWGQAQSGFVRLMGQPLGSEGRDFSAQTFVKAWQDMTPKAKNVMFGSKGEMRSALDDFASVTEKLAARDSMRNTSNTAGQALTGLAFLSLGNLPALAGQAVSSYGLAKLWTNPRFVHWATGYSKMLAGAEKAGATPAFDKQMDLLRKVAVSQPAIAQDAMGLQNALSQAFQQTPARLAAAPSENQEKP